MHPTRQYGDTSEGRGVPASWLVHFSARAVFTEHVRRKAVSASGRGKKEKCRSNARSQKRSSVDRLQIMARLISRR